MHICYGWTDWAEIFGDTHGWPGGVIGYGNSKFCLSKIYFFFHGQRQALQRAINILINTFIENLNG